jgi:hypothetical protein
MNELNISKQEANRLLEQHQNVRDAITAYNAL